MKKYLQQKLKNEKGMTLIELLAVIVIIAIIAAIAVPAIGNVIDSSRVGAMKSDNLNAIAASELYFIDYPEAATVDLTTLTTNDAYFQSGSSLTSFVYTKSSKTVTSAATVGKMSMTATGSTKANISAAPNSLRTTAGTIKVTKN